MMAVHHKRAFAHVETRVALDNLVLLCQRCHRWVHSKQNTERRFIV
jgi:predicted HNH restriction endonuclease